MKIIPKHWDSLNFLKLGAKVIQITDSHRHSSLWQKTSPDTRLDSFINSDDAGSGAGQGGGGGGSIREAGGSLGKRAVAKEEQYFLKRQQELLKRLKEKLKERRKRRELERKQKGQGNEKSKDLE